ncbi:hypothetical protein QE152_g30314 [Popillia japonica]|uniref:Uncharacterized protein n=1 Tax=Popillia japonica TaxID=7064 RepID=A0AAW1JF29_POPJA
MPRGSLDAKVEGVETVEVFIVSVERELNHTSIENFIRNDRRFVLEKFSFNGAEQNRRWKQIQKKDEEVIELSISLAGGDIAGWKRRGGLNANSYEPEGISLDVVQT